MSKLLIIYAHPNRIGHHGYFLKQIEAQLAVRQYADYEVIDLYALHFNPVLNDEELYSAGRYAISPENLSFQEKITAADYLLFIYPTWWQNMPAILKGFIDKVFTSRFAFVYKNGLPVGLLKGKKAAVFTATGGPRIYSRIFKRDRVIKILTKDVLSFSGIKSRGFMIGSANKLDDKNMKKLGAAAQKVLQYLLG